MSVATFPGSNFGTEHIGAASHWRRNLSILLAIAVGGGTMGAYYAYTGRSDAAALERLESFRAAYADQCEAPGFAEPTPRALADIYLNSSALRDAVDQQLDALRRGSACDDVALALRKADFPVAAAPPPAATIELHPGGQP